LSFRLVSVVMGLAIVCAGLVSWTRYVGEDAALTEQIEWQGTLLVRSMVHSVPEALVAPYDPETLQATVDEVLRESKWATVAFAAISRASDGKILAPLGATLPSDPEQRGIRMFDASVQLRTSGESGRVIPLGRCYVGLNVTPLRRQLRARAIELLLQNLAGFGLIAGVLVLLLRRMVGSPLRSLDRQAQRIGAGDLEHPIVLAATDEFGRLATTLESMRRSLQTSYESLAVQNAQLKEVDRLKDEFLANMSHEIRTPLHSILGNADLMSRSDGSERAQCVDAVQRNANHLLCLVNQVLDFSKMQSGNLCLEAVPVQLQSLLEDVLACMRPTATEKHMPLRLTVLPGTPVSLQTDPLRLRQVLMNVIGNAIKFTERGAIDVEVGPAPGDAGRLRIRVVDQGIGITSEQMQRLFRPFVQADASLTRRHGGTGLGLVISREVARALGGDVTIESTAGVGTTVTITTACPPVAAPPPAPAPDVAPTSSKITGRVLLVDDAADNRRLLSVVLKKAGLEVTTAENGALACEAAAAAAAHGRPFDLVLMDIQMPVMDGITAAARLRGDGHAMPMLAITAHATEQDRERCRAAGFDGYASKPISPTHLRELVRQHLPSRS
jgi:signal transduction histidine kinase/CheY-like chemotaxis protein